MNKISQFAAMASVLLGLNVGVAGADDPKSPTSSSSSSATPSDKPFYVTSGDVVGQVIKVDDNSLTLRVTWYTQAPPKSGGNRNMYGNWNRGNSGRNPQQMYMHMMQMQQQMMRQMIQAQMRAAATKPTEHHQDYVMNFAVDAQVRTMRLPPKLDNDGKKTYYTADELQKMKGNPNVKGYQIERSELKPGQLVEVHVVHIAKQKDNLVRYAVILQDGNLANNPPAKSSSKNN